MRKPAWTVALRRRAELTVLGAFEFAAIPLTRVFYERHGTPRRPSPCSGCVRAPGVTKSHPGRTGRRQGTRLGKHRAAAGPTAWLREISGTHPGRASTA